VVFALGKMYFQNNLYNVGTDDLSIFQLAKMNSGGGGSYWSNCLGFNKPDGTQEINGVSKMEALGGK